MFAESLDQVAKRKEQPVRFQSVAKEEKQQLTQRRQEVQKFRGERQQLETPAPVAATEKPSRLSEPAKVKLRRSPIVGQLIDKLGKDKAPPKRPEAPKPDLKVEPKPRKAGGTAVPPKGESKDKGKGKDK